jgi:hypothetical protein
MTGRLQRILNAMGLLSLALCPIANGVQVNSTRGPTVPIASSQSLAVGQATLQIDFAEGPLDLAKNQITHRIQMAANAVMVYYGQFPVSRARILVIPVAGKHGVLQGTTWGNREGFPAFLRLRIGQSTTASELSEDWIITHELVHTALPSLPDDQHWLEEGLASYVEPVARVQAGELTSQVIWRDMMHGMPNGEPGLDDHGLNNTHTWGRTYWGGALFCMMADIQIRKQTGNRLGLQDSLRAIVAAGGTIDKDWPLARILSVGDQATGTRVLEEMYARWSETPVPVNLAEVWSQLGVQMDQAKIVFDSKAPLAPTRLAITDHPKSNAIK